MNKTSKYLSMAVAEDVTLAEHDAKYHKPKYDPKTMTCEFRERRAKLDPVDGDVAEGGISGIYTGSAASYSRPSLLHIGTGEGSQVYGWGLYGSSRRGVAEHYSDIATSINNMRTTRDAGSKYVELEIANGGRINAGEFQKMAARYGVGVAAVRLDEFGYDVDSAIKSLEGSRDGVQGYGWMPHDEAQKNIDWLEKIRGRVKMVGSRSNHLYEQTFFTNRAKGDESHLLSWYEPVSNDNAERVVGNIDNGIGAGGKFSIENGVLLAEHPNVRGGQTGKYEIKTGEGLYNALTTMLGSPKSASEFLARADIDGIKYPVDSYGGKSVKDGDKAGWNYVSFRDDNIRVDKKYVDGKEQDVKDSSTGRTKKYLDLVETEDATLSWTSGKNSEYKVQWVRRRPIDRVPKKTVKKIIAENCKLIKTIDEDMLPLVAGKIYGMLTGKVDAEDFIDWCVDECGIEEWQAYRIARDQIVKAREWIKIADWKSRGINYVVWCHSGNDNEPREYHIRKWNGKSGVRTGKPNGLNGFVFRIDDPPVIDKKTGERGFPSTLIGCKCFLRAIRGA